MTEPNYGAKMPNSTAYIKTFNIGDLNGLWSPSDYVLDKKKINVLTPTIQKDIYIPRNIYLGGNIVHVPSQNNFQIKENITTLSSNCLEIDPLVMLKLKDLQDQIKDLQNQLDEIINEIK